jgi:hypothetical protein
MLRRLKNCGILTLILGAGMAVMQPVSAQAADRHDRDAYHDRGRADRGWNRDNRVVQDRHVWYGGNRDRGYVYYNYAPRPSYGYSYPSAVYQYGAYPNCPR